jgi:hypothetical protein
VDNKAKKLTADYADGADLIRVICEIRCFEILNLHKRSEKRGY